MLVERLMCSLLICVTICFVCAVSLYREEKEGEQEEWWKLLEWTLKEFLIVHLFGSVLCFINDGRATPCDAMRPPEKVSADKDNSGELPHTEHLMFSEVCNQCAGGPLKNNEKIVWWLKSELVVVVLKAFKDGKWCNSSVKLQCGIFKIYIKYTQRKYRQE